MLVIPDKILNFLNQTPLPKGPIVVGVSGGADSLYLTYILSLWCKKTKRKLLAVTVDHQLRPESKAEAEWVHKQLLKHQIAHQILTWKGPKPKTHVEEYAREERYNLLTNFCRKNKSKVLFIAHHQQDQAETFWARLSRGSGLDGLCAIQPMSNRQDILLVRPLLNISKTEILGTLKKHHLKWVEDPMNQDLNYERVRWRQQQSVLDQLNLTAATIAKSTQRLQYAKEALDFYTKEFISKNLIKSPYGFVSIDEQLFTKLPIDIRIRVLAYILKILASPKKMPSLESIEKIVLKIPKYATLSGCQWVISHHKIFIAQEDQRIPNTPIPAQKWTPWGSILIWSNQPIMAQTGAPKKRLKNIPFLIQRTFLKLPEGTLLLLDHAQKELEKKSKLDYKEKRLTVAIQFNEQKEVI